jgi:glycerol-3-phosphate cytidylyltransferase
MTSLPRTAIDDREREDGGKVRRVLTYGTFDLLHHGHIRILKRAKALGDFLVVAISTDEFNAGKGKKSFHDYETRKEIVEAIRYVDLVIPEESWEQKLDDVKRYDIDIVAMGDDWAGSDRFDYLKDHCELVFLPRTEGISTTEIKEDLGRGGQ